MKLYKHVYALLGCGLLTIGCGGLNVTANFSRDSGAAKNTGTANDKSDTTDATVADNSNKSSDKATAPVEVSGAFLSDCSWLSEDPASGDSIGGCHITDASGGAVDPAQININSVTLRTVDAATTLVAVVQPGSEWVVRFIVPHSAYGKKGKVDLDFSVAGKKSGTVVRGRMNNLVLDKVPDTPPAVNTATATDNQVAQPAVVQNTDPAPAAALDGTWSASGYTCMYMASSRQDVKITQSGNSFTGVKVQGDTCLSAGKKTFDGTISGNKVSMKMYGSYGTVTGTYSGTLSGNTITVNTGSFWGGSNLVLTKK